MSGITLPYTKVEADIPTTSCYIISWGPVLKRWWHQDDKARDCSIDGQLTSSSDPNILYSTLATSS